MYQFTTEEIRWFFSSELCRYQLYRVHRDTIKLRSIVSEILLRSKIHKERKTRTKTLTCGVFLSWLFFNLRNSAISQNTHLGDLEMCMYRCEYLIKETLVTVRMRTVQILYLALFTFNLLPWQSNYKQGQEDNGTEVWAQMTLFPTQIYYLSIFPTHSCYLSFLIQTAQQLQICVWISVQIIFQVLSTKIFLGPCAMDLQKVPSE